MQIILGLPINKSLLIRKRKSTARNFVSLSTQLRNKINFTIETQYLAYQCQRVLSPSKLRSKRKQNNPITTGARVGPARQTRGVRRNNGGYYYRHSFPRFHLPREGSTSLTVSSRTAAAARRIRSTARTLPMRPIGRPARADGRTRAHGTVPPGNPFLSCLRLVRAVALPPRVHS